MRTRAHKMPVAEKRKWAKLAEAELLRRGAVIQDYKPKTLRIAAQKDHSAEEDDGTDFQACEVNDPEAETFTYFVGVPLDKAIDVRHLEAFNANAWGDESQTAADAVLKAHAKYPDAEIVVPPVALRGLARKPPEGICNLLDLSTGHLSKDVLDTNTEDWKDRFGLRCKMLDPEYGRVFVTVPDPLDPDNTLKPDAPKCLHDVVAFAHKHNCLYMLVDCDGSVYEDLPFTEW